MGVHKKGEGEMGSRQSENKAFPLAAEHIENYLLSLNICNTIKYSSVFLCKKCTCMNDSLTT